MVAEHLVRLAEGLWRQGVQETEAVVRPLTGADEALVADGVGWATPAESATALIAAATLRIGRIEAPGADAARELTVGDRERLLLALHALSFGSRVDAVASCPAAECGATIEIDLALPDLLTPADSGARLAPAGPGRELTVEDDQQRWRVRFRLPNGGDQERVARLAAPDPAAAGDLILSRCVLELTDGAGRPAEPQAVLATLRSPLAEAFASLDPQAETTLAFRCPACARQSMALFDAAAFLLAELADPGGVYAHVDQLARVYHWSEAEILALPVTRRRRYLALVAEG